MFIDVNNIKYNAYISLVRDMLKNNDTIMFSCKEPFEFDFEDTNTDLNISDWQDLNIANYENVVCFKINDSKTLDFFDKFGSYEKETRETRGETRGRFSRLLTQTNFILSKKGRPAKADRFFHIYA